MLKNNWYNLDPGWVPRLLVEAQFHITFCLLNTSAVSLAGKLQTEHPCKLLSHQFESTGHRVPDHRSKSCESSLCKLVSTTAVLLCFQRSPTNYISEGCCLLLQGNRGRLEGHKSLTLFPGAYDYQSPIFITLSVYHSNVF